MKVLVTGGTGYIGRVLVPDLLKKGYDISVMDRGFLDYTDPANDYGNDLKIIRDDIRTCGPDLLIILITCCLYP